MTSGSIKTSFWSSCLQVIGLACFKALSADGVSFAIPIDTAKDVIQQLEQSGRVLRPYIGIKMLQLNQHNAAQMRQKDPNFPEVKQGILVPYVASNSPAARSGLREGDVITGILWCNCLSDDAVIVVVCMGQDCKHHVVAPQCWQSYSSSTDRMFYACTIFACKVDNVWVQWQMIQYHLYSLTCLNFENMCGMHCESKQDWESCIAICGCSQNDFCLQGLPDRVTA